MKARMKRRHTVLGVLCLMYFVSYIDRVNIAVAKPMIGAAWHLSQAELGTVMSAFALPYTLMQIPGGWLADKFGPRRVLAALSLIWGVATILSGVTTGLVTLIGARLLLGIGEGGAFPTATRAFTYWMPPSERGFAQGITHAFARIGGAVTPPLVVFIALRSGWRASFVVLGVISLAWTALWLTVFSDTPSQDRRVSPEELREIGVDEDEAKKGARGPTPWRSIAARMWLVTLVDFCYGWGLWVFLNWLPSYLGDARGFDTQTMALYASLTLSAGAVGDALGGLISDRLLKKTKSLRVARSGLLSAGLVGAAAAIALAIFASAPTTAVIWLALAFFCLELTNGVLWSLPIDIAVKYAGTASGMMNTGYGLAGTISPIVFGLLVDKTGGYEASLGMTAVLVLLGAVAALFIDPMKKVEGAGAGLALNIDG
jgi:sugar phosphate permease